MLILTGLLLCLCAAAIYFYGYSIYAAIDLFSQPQIIDPNFHPPVTILKPLCGLDRDSYENLASFCQQDYPEYQIVFGVQDSSDPVLEIVEHITAEFPQLDIQCVVSDRTIGLNPKVNNLANIAPFAKHSILVLSDSDIRVGTDYLQHILQPIKDPQVGVVTCLYRSLAQGWVSTLEALGIAIENHAQVLVERKMFGMRAAIGSTIVIRKSVLEAIGGFAVAADHLMDDYQLGHSSGELGHTVVLSNYVVNHVMAASTLTNFFQHQLRWAVSIRASRLWGYLGIILTHGTTMSLLLLLITQFSSLSWIVLLITWSMRFLMVWVVGIKLLQEPSVKQLFWLVPLRDLISSIVWILGLFGNTIQWRGQALKLKDGKLIEAIS